MRNKFILSICFCAMLIISCEKESNNRITDSTYTVDSIQVFDDSSYSYTIKRSGNNWTSFNSPLAPNGENFIKTVSNDTTYFKEPRYNANFNPNEIWYNSIDLQVKANQPAYCKTIFNVEGSVGQDNAESDVYVWKYDNGRITEIIKTYYKASGLTTLNHPLIIQRDSFTVNYTGNVINKIDFLTRNVYNENDPASNGSFRNQYAIDFSYPNNITNPIYLIGIDVNDLILTNKITLQSIGNVFNLGFGVPAFGMTGLGSHPITFNKIDPETDILNNLSTYTNGGKLIENMHISNYNLMASIDPANPMYSDVDLNATYTLDTSFKNRISEINLIATVSLFPNFIQTKKYKFFFHP